MDDARPISPLLLFLLLVAAAAAIYGTVLHTEETERRMAQARHMERDLGEATRLSESIMNLRSTMAQRADQGERMLISFIEDRAGSNRISMASITIDPGTLKEAGRVNRFYKEVDTVVRIKQIPLKSIILFIADMQTKDANLKAKQLSLMPCENDPANWDARIVLSYFVYDEDITTPGTEGTP